MIRLILLAIFLFVFFLVSLPIFLIEWILEKVNKNARDASSRAIVRFAFRVCLRIAGVKLEVSGKENIPEQACLFVGNHNGFFDILSTYVNIPHKVGYVSKQEIKKVPFLNIWMENIGCLFLDRKNIKEGLKVVLKGVDMLKNGHSIFVFPEGTRSPDGKMLPFKEGSMKMAEKANVPVVPVCIKGSEKIFENQMPYLRKGVIRLEFGEPIIIDELEKEDRKFLGAYTQKKIQVMLDGMNDIG